jgi:hypothetical protein
VTRRDAYTLGAVAVIGLVAVFWFMLLAPKRSELGKLDTTVAESQAALQAAQREAEQFTQARVDFPTDYTTVARLGKAVPADPDIPSLVVQLDRAANEAGVDFRKLVSKSGTSGDSASSTPPAPAAPSSDAAAGAGATGASGASTGPTGAAGATSSGTAAGATGDSASASATAAPANATLTPTMPLGVDVGPAGMSLAKFEFVFQGNFFRMADLLHNIRKMVQRRNRQLVVSGRLVSVGGISLAEGDDTFPQVKATVAAAAYLLPQSQGLFAGATSQGPANATAATPTPPSGASPSAPPAAVVSPR